MKRIFLAIFMFLNFSLFYSSSATSGIFKCLDSEGQVIYSQQATCDKPDTVKYKSKKEKTKKKKQSQQKRLTKEQKKQQRCKEAKESYASYKQAPFLTKQVQFDGKTIKVRLTKEESDKAVSEIQQEKEYWCKK